VLNCLTWTAYAWWDNDVYLLIPNIFGLVLGIAQCALMVLYPNVAATPKSVADEPELLSEDRVAQMEA